MNISKHFTVDEVKCKCGCGFADVNPRLVDLAESVRSLLGKPMIVHCACRCPKHNKEVGGVSNSQHVQGLAMDFHCNGMKHEDVYKAILNAKKAGKLPTLGGLFLYNWGCHIDAREDYFRAKDYR